MGQHTASCGRLEQAKKTRNSKLLKQLKRKESMSNKFDELTKGLAQSVTRRAAFKKFGVGLAGMALACFGLANRAEAAKLKLAGYGEPCATNNDCRSGGWRLGSSCVCLSSKYCPDATPA